MALPAPPLVLAALACTAAAAALLWVRLGAAYARAARRAATLPFDHALLLGGDLFRERTAAALLAGAATAQACIATSARASLRRRCAATRWPSLPVLVSSAHGGAASLFAAAGVAQHRLTVDERATDTVTNCTVSCTILRAAGARHVAVLTSAAHVRRAAPVAALVLGSAGLGATVVPLRDGDGETAGKNASPESLLRVVRDVARSALWVFTGLHGGNLGRMVHPERFWHLDAAARRTRAAADVAQR